MVLVVSSPPPLDPSYEMIEIKHKHTRKVVGVGGNLLWSKAHFFLPPHI
jgi:hypothetical protein